MVALYRWGLKVLKPDPGISVDALVGDEHRYALCREAASIRVHFNLSPLGDLSATPSSIMNLISTICSFWPIKITSMCEHGDADPKKQLLSRDSQGFVHDTTKSTMMLQCKLCRPVQHCMKRVGFALWYCNTDFGQLLAPYSPWPYVGRVWVSFFT